MVTSRLIQLYDMGSGNLRVMIMVKSRLIIQLTTWGNGDFKVTLMVLTRLIWGYGNFTIMFLVTTTTGKMVNSRQCPWLRQGLQLMTLGKGNFKVMLMITTTTVFRVMLMVLSRLIQLTTWGNGNFKAILMAIIQLTTYSKANSR